MAGWNKTNVQLGDSTTATNNFCLDATAQNGTMKLARGNAGATTQDIATVNGSGVVNFPQGLTIGGSSGQRMLLTASQATTSGTFVDFTSIPSWAKKITVIFDQVSTNSTSAVQLQAVTSGGVVNSGYTSLATYCGATNSAGFVTYTTGIGTVYATAASSRVGHVVCTLLSGNTWVFAGCMTDNTNTTVTVTGRVALASTLTALRVTTINGTDTFDAGSVSLLIEGY